MQDVDELLDGDQDDNLTRRDVLGALAGGVTAAATAGCIGGNSETPESSETPTNTAAPEEVTSTQTDTQAQTPSETPTQTGTQTQSGTPTSTSRYPQEDSENLQARLDDLVREREAAAALKFNIDDLDIPEFPNILERYNEDRVEQKHYDDLTELAREGASFPMPEALYMATKLDSPAGQDTMYFFAEGVERGGVLMYPNPNDAPRSSINNDKYFVASTIPSEVSVARENQSELFNTADAEYEDLVHAVELENAPHIQDALN